MNTEEKPHIHIDEDWKAQVEAEKTAAATPATASVASAESGDAPRGEATEPPLPPATFTFLLTTIATQAMIALGQVPNPITGKEEPRPAQAKHYIDTLAMLEEKTKGNRSAAESQLLEDILHQLRMAYVMLNTAVA